MTSHSCACSNDTRHFGVGRRLQNLPLLREKLAATNDRTLALQADLLSSTVDTGQLAALAEPTIVGQRRIPGLKLHDYRVIRLLETLLQPAGWDGLRPFKTSCNRSQLGARSFYIPRNLPSHHEEGRDDGLGHIVRRNRRNRSGRVPQRLRPTRRVPSW
jgi:hypothetical protein